MAHEGVAVEALAQPLPARGARAGPGTHVPGGAPAWLKVLVPKGARLAVLARHVHFDADPGAAALGSEQGESSGTRAALRCAVVAYLEPSMTSLGARSAGAERTARVHNYAAAPPRLVVLCGEEQ